jgi:hypothetical protein
MRGTLSNGPPAVGSRVPAVRFLVLLRRRYPGTGAR